MRRAFMYLRKEFFMKIQSLKNYFKTTGLFFKYNGKCKKIDKLFSYIF